MNHAYVGTEHLLLGLIELGQGVAVNVLKRMGLDLERVRIEVEQHVGPHPDAKMVGNIPYTLRVKKGARARINAMTRPPDVKEIETIRAEKEAAIKGQDFEKAAALRDSEKQTRNNWERIANGRREKDVERKVVVTGEDIIHIVSKWTGVR